MQSTNEAASEANTEVGVPGEPEPETPPGDGDVAPTPPEENTTPPVTADPPPVDPDWPGG